MDAYAAALRRDLIRRAPDARDHTVDTVYFGGGTPSYLGAERLCRILETVFAHYRVEKTAEITTEANPDSARDAAALRQLRSAGFNRISLGMQSACDDELRLIGRVHTHRETVEAVSAARTAGFDNLSLDLIYGLPKQTPESFAFTLKRVAELNPDRLSVFNYAHLPTIFAAQRKIKDADLPSPQQKLDILQETIAFLTQSGYQFIGMDHFARPDDELAVAQREGVLHRNFQGYTTQGDTDLLGMGVSAISMIGDCYAQNQKELKQYYQQVDEQGNALWRGIALTRDDCIRRDVIKSLICNFRLDYAPIEKQWDLHFADYFAEDLKLLAPLAKDGLVDVDEKGIQVTAKGRLLIRNICMCFDTYLRQKARMQQFSRVI